MILCVGVATLVNLLFRRMPSGEGAGKGGKMPADRGRQVRRRKGEGEGEGEGRRKKEEGRRKKEEGRRKREEGRGKKGKGGCKGTGRIFLCEEQAPDSEWWSQEDCAWWSKGKRTKKGFSNGDGSFQKGWFRTY